MLFVVIWLPTASAVDCLMGDCTGPTSAYAAPGETIAVQGRFENTDIGTCDAEILSFLGSEPPNMTLLNPIQSLLSVAPSEIREFDIHIDVDTAVDATLDGYKTVWFSAVDVCTSSFHRVCVVPQDDTSAFGGWSGTIATWYHTMNPTPAQFAGRYVREFPGGVVQDNCYDNAAANAAAMGLTLGCDLPTTFSGNPWESGIDSSNVTSFPDNTGYYDYCVDEYRMLGAHPCTLIGAQRMEMQCVWSAGVGWVPYDAVEFIYLAIDSSNVWAKKGTSQWYSTPYP